MESRQSYQKLSKGTTKQIRIDNELHRLLKVKASADGESLKALVEDGAMIILGLASVEDKTN